MSHDNPCVVVACLDQAQPESMYCRGHKNYYYDPFVGFLPSPAVHVIFVTESSPKRRKVCAPKPQTKAKKAKPPKAKKAPQKAKSVPRRIPTPRPPKLAPLPVPIFKSPACKEVPRPMSLDMQRSNFFKTIAKFRAKVPTRPLPLKTE